MWPSLCETLCSVSCTMEGKERRKGKREGRKDGEGRRRERGASALVFRDTLVLPWPITEPLSTAACGRLLVGPDSSSVHDSGQHSSVCLTHWDFGGYICTEGSVDLSSSSLALGGEPPLILRLRARMGLMYRGGESRCLLRPTAPSCSTQLGRGRRLKCSYDPYLTDKETEAGSSKWGIWGLNQSDITVPAPS